MRELNPVTQPPIKLLSVIDLQSTDWSISRKWHARKESNPLEIPEPQSGAYPIQPPPQKEPPHRLAPGLGRKRYTT